MNRHQRRAASKTPPQAPAAQSQPAYIPNMQTAAEKPGLLLRFFAKVLLAEWVLKRVQNPEVERTLASLAQQAGRPDVAMRLLNRARS